MKKPKVKFIYHNPNSEEATAKAAAALFLKAGKAKFESILKERAAELKIPPK